MRITRIKIRYFRSIENIEFQPTAITPICGTNSSGKSNILRALRLAFLKDISAEKLAENITYSAGPNAQCVIELEFDQPTPLLSASFPAIQAGTPFVFKTTFKRTGGISRSLDGTKLSDSDFPKFSSNFLVIYVPAIRDIAIDGLRPFKEALLDAFVKQKGADSLANINKAVRGAVSRRGKAMLSGPNSIAKQWLHVDTLDVDTTDISIEEVLPTVGIRVKIGASSFPLSKLGTGHQSSVVIKLYRELGTGSGLGVIYLFEEPDNHLHPTSIGVIAKELHDCASTADGQVFLTTHSPYLLNHFDPSNALPLTLDKSRLTIKRSVNLKRTPRSLRIALGKFGLRPAESLLARRIIVVEGPNDVNTLRTLIELHTKALPEHQDVHVIPAGGKAQVAELCLLLDELGADWKAVFDWDATQSTHQAILRNNLTPAEIGTTRAAINTLQATVASHPIRQTKMQKQLASMLAELVAPPAPKTFETSTLGDFVIRLGKLPAGPRATLRTSVNRGQAQNVNNVLSAVNTYLWKDTIETVVLPASALAEADAEARLIASGILNAPLAPADRRNRLLQKIKDLAHEPEQLSGLIEHLWGKGHYAYHEAVRATRYLLQ